jgi:P63C domain
MSADKTTVNEAGAKGGKARAEKLSKERKSEIGKKAAESRWKMLKATHDGDLVIGTADIIPCAVITGGIRVITQRGMATAFGRHATGKSLEDGKIPHFLKEINLRPFISEELVADLIKPFEYRPLHGGRSAYGFKAELVPQICDVWLQAKLAGVLTEAQEPIYLRAYTLIKGMATVGINALIDEATGYQEVRDKLALQTIINTYFRKEFASWTKKFPDEYYKEIFRLRGWTWRDMKGGSPRILAHYTNDFIYSRLAPGVLEELQVKNPLDINGKRRVKHHQWLTADIGHPVLNKQLFGVIGLMKSSDSWDQLLIMIDRSYPKTNLNTEIVMLPEVAE